MKKIAVLTSRESWFTPYAKALTARIASMGHSCGLFHSHEAINSSYEIIFILSYFKIISGEYLKKHCHNLVVHESDLPKGKGWSPYFWQILEGKNKIPVVLFEAMEEMDAGDIYFKDYISLNGTELNAEIREKQAEKTMELCLRFLKAGPRIKGKPQKGKSTFYARRRPVDSKVDVNKSIRDQFNLLRIVNNEEFPGFFIYKGVKYILKIEKCAD
jgi:methionyl-tRNA formyltransferase